MRRPSSRVRNWLLSALTSARLLASVTRAAAGVALVAAPVVVAGCSNEYDVKTEAGLKKSFEEGKNLHKAIDQLKDLKEPEMKAIAPVLQKRFIDGAPGFESALFQRISQTRDPSLVPAYEHALRSGKAELVLSAAAVVGDLGLKDAEAALVEAFDATSDFGVKQSLLDDGRKLNSAEMAKRAGALLTGDVDNIPMSLLGSVCKTLEQSPTPEAIPALIPLIYRKSPSGRTINAECTSALQSYGAAAYPALLDVAQRKHKTIEHMVRRKGYKLSREEVLLNISDVVLGLGNKDAPQILLTFLTDPVPIREPSFIANNPATTDVELNDWNTMLMVSTQQTIQVINRIGVKGHEDKAREALLGILRWNLNYRHKFRIVAGALMFEPVIRGEAARALAENDLLTEQHLTEVLAMLRDPAWDKDEEARFRRTLLAGNLMMYFSISGIPGVPAKLLYDELASIIQTDLAFNAYGKLADVGYCLDLLANPPENAPPPDKRTIKTEADCYEQNVKDLKLLLEPKPVEIAPPPDLKPKQLEAWNLDPVRNAYKNLRAANEAMLTKCQADADRLTCYKTEFAAFQQLAATAFPKLPQGVYAEIQIPAMQLGQAEKVLETTTRCEAESNKLECYKLTMDTNKAEPEAGAFLRSVYVLGKSGKPEYFAPVMEVYRAQYDSAQYMGNALYRLAAPEHLPLIEEVAKNPSTQVMPPERRTGQNILLAAQMSYLKHFVANRAKGG